MTLLCVHNYYEPFNKVINSVDSNALCVKNVLQVTYCTAQVGVSLRVFCAVGMCLWLMKSGWWKQLPTTSRKHLRIHVRRLLTPTASVRMHLFISE